MRNVGIIGGSGFIGSYLTKTFLEKNYQVKVSVTDLSKNEKYRHLYKLPNSNGLVIAELDVQNIESIRKFVPGCEIVIHGGTPFQLDVKSPQSELFNPTVDGTENFLHVIRQTPSVKKVVVIASAAAYNTSFPMPARDKKPDHLYSEEDVPSMHKDDHPYSLAKFYADQTVREFLDDHPDLPFEIVSLFPTLVIGKPLSGRTDSTSVGLQHLFKNKLAPNPFMEMLYEQDIEFAMVDVKDVAEAVFKAATVEDLHRKNYLLSSESWKVSDISRMLNGQQPAGKSRIVYSNRLASRELGIDFSSPQKNLNEFKVIKSANKNETISL